MKEGPIASMTAASVNASEPSHGPNSTTLVVAYLLQFVVPVFLLFDILAARMGGKILLGRTSLNTALVGFSTLWLVAGLGAFFLSRNRRAFLLKSIPLLVSLYAIYLLSIPMEIVARLIGIAPAIPGVQFPRSKAVATVDPKIFPGVSGTKNFTINQLGLRGPMPPSYGAYRIVAIGGSTTECAALDDSETWPARLMEGINSSEKGLPVWVGNAGVSGKNTVDHIVLMQWLPGILHVDMVIFLIGINDLHASMALEGASSQELLEKTAAFPGDLPRGTLWRSENPYPLYRRLRIYLAIRDAALNLKQRFRRPVASKDLVWVGRDGEFTSANIVQLRKRRADAPVATLPDLSTGIAEYRKRVLTLTSRCRELGLRCLFLTQPSMWRSGLSPAEQSLFWLGYAGPWAKVRGYLAPGDLARAMDLYNVALLDLCRQTGAECYDIAPKIPKNTTAFYDEMHFNEAGAGLVAQTLKEYLLSKPPFAPQSR